MTSDERPPILQAADNTKSYAGVHALKAVSFELLPGEVHALIGENGAGKSTLIKVITGAVTPDSGTLMVGGYTVAHNSPAIARALGIAAVYQQPSLFPDLTVAENIALSLESGGVWRTVDWNGRDGRARELLARAGSDIRPDRLVATLSMPEQQIVEIAKAIGARAKVLILDEPTASLDPDVALRVRQGLIDVAKNEGTALLMTSHDMTDVEHVCERVLFLSQGRVVADGTPASIAASYGRGNLEGVFLHLAGDREVSAAQQTDHP
jgi:rhamnose transport system ATP-binding protein